MSKDIPTFLFVMGWDGRQCWQPPTKGSSKSVASFCRVEFSGYISISLSFFVLTFFFLANKGSHSKGIFLFFLSFFLTNSHSNNEALIGSGSSSVKPFPATKGSEQIYVSLLILLIVKPFLLHECTNFFAFYVSSFCLFFSHSVIPSLTFPTLANLI